jgi:hypothetical protein
LIHGPDRCQSATVTPMPPRATANPKAPKTRATTSCFIPAEAYERDATRKTQEQWVWEARVLP